MARVVHAPVSGEDSFIPPTCWVEFLLDVFVYPLVF